MRAAGSLLRDSRANEPSSGIAGRVHAAKAAYRLVDLMSGY
jgi:hypothetical protein